MYAIGRLSVALSLLLLSILPVTRTQPHYKITDYHVSFGPPVRTGRIWFRLDGEAYCLLVDPRTLAIELEPDPDDQAPALPTLEALLRTGSSSPYERALQSAEANARPMQDAGITHSLPDEKGIVLTIDLCLSHKPLDRVIVNQLVRQLAKLGTPIPLAFSITGVWMREHPNDLAWIKDRIRGGQLNVTWINHSFNHRVSPSLPLNENFLLEPGTNIADEVLKTETAMITNGLIPSVFFRFPGLISSQALVEDVVRFGLIPVGSDAWLAKRQQPGRGSVVLIHGNGNEPVGVQNFIPLLKRKKADITHRDWLLYDLRESIDASEQRSR